ncbi:MAG: TlpA family protein disulfide reductase [Propionibacteriaceae bacterium]|nr:TlpA family protein disulfide reductase [Propionibacteriaceae bacterium]
MTASTLRTVIVLVITTVVIVGGVLMVRMPWSSSDPSGVTSIPVTVAPGQEPPAVGKPAPDFSTVTIDGETITLSDLKGKPVWLVFGATWCPNCRSEAPDVQAASQRFEDRVTVVSIYVGEAKDTVVSYTQRLRLTHPAVVDTSKTIATSYGVMGIPVHYFIDSKGVIAKVSVGNLSLATMTEILDSLS